MNKVRKKFPRYIVAIQVFHGVLSHRFINKIANRMVVSFCIQYSVIGIPSSAMTRVFSAHQK